VCLRQEARLRSDRCWLKARLTYLLISSAAEDRFFQTAILVWNWIHFVAPAYLGELCVSVENVPAGRLRLRCWLDCSLSTHLPREGHNWTAHLCIPRTHSVKRKVRGFQPPSSTGSWKLTCSDSADHHPSPLWRLTMILRMSRLALLQFTYNFTKGACLHVYKIRHLSSSNNIASLALHAQIRTTRVKPAAMSSDIVERQSHRACAYVCRESSQCFGDDKAAVLRHSHVSYRAAWHYCVESSWCREDEVTAAACRYVLSTLPCAMWN